MFEKRDSLEQDNIHKKHLMSYRLFGRILPKVEIINIH